MLIQRAIDTARRQGAVGALPFPLWLAGRDAATSDRPHVAVALYEEAIRLARETGQATSLCAGLAGLACVEARQGRETAHAAEALQLARQLGLAFFELWALDALAELELGRGNLEAAIKHLRAKQRLLAERGSRTPTCPPCPISPRSTRTRRSSLRPAALAKGQPWSLARLARAQGDYEPRWTCTPAPRTASRPPARCSPRARRCAAPAAHPGA